jgi:nucleotide-binding universal stress UspA family protein
LNEEYRIHELLPIHPEAPIMATTPASTQASSQLTHIIAATDLSELGDRAVLSGLRMAKTQTKVVLHLIAVAFGEGNGVRLPWENLDRLYQQGEAEARMQGRIADLIAPEMQFGADAIERINIYLSTGNPAQRVVQLAEEVDADLIVCGTHGRTGIRRAMLGSVAEEIVRQAPCAVLVIRPRDFYRGSKLPEVQPALEAGAPSLRPFHHATTHHYRDRVQATTSRMLPTW